MTSSAVGPPTDPFLSSQSSRLSHLERSRTIINAATDGPPSRRCQTLSLAPHERIVIHPLTPSEISTLEGPGCRCKCDDWSKVRAMRLTRGEAEGGCDASDWLRRNVKDTAFGGWVVLGVPPCCSSTGAKNAQDDYKDESDGGIETKFGPPGVRSNLLVRDCVLEYGCVVYGNGTVSNAHVAGGAALVNCGCVSFSDCAGGKFTDGMVITVGAESGGGRDVNITVESTLIDACASLGMGNKVAKAGASNETMNIPMNIVCPCSYIAHTPNVTGVYLSPHSRIDGATSVSKAVLLPHSSITNSVTAKFVLLQWSSSITSNSSAESALIMEQSHVGPNSILAHSILGPDVHVSAGEVHATILGPNTNAHHQSLLIGVLWPLGRGNVGYGANVGSNHTSRLPDQECASGEGTFWGLTTCIKMPVDLTSAPYSVVAAGSSVSPGQRVTMPFSLIMDGPGGATNIMPGWVLYASPYTISRSEAKFAKRRKAKFHGFYTGWRIVRPGVIDLCLEARRSLLAAAGGGSSSSSGQAATEAATERKVYKTDRDVPGIGSSHLSERSRLGGIKAYSDIIRLYALRGLLDQARQVWKSSSSDPAAFVRELSDLVGDTGKWVSGNDITAHAEVKSAKKVVEWPPLPWEEPSFSDPAALWKHQRCVLVAEAPSLVGGHSPPSLSPSQLVFSLLRKYAAMELDHATRVRKSKARDDMRGAATVPGYAESHVKADDDAVVRDAMKDAREAERAVEIMAEALGVTEKREGSVDGSMASRL